MISRSGGGLQVLFEQSVFLGQRQGPSEIRPEDGLDRLSGSTDCTGTENRIAEPPARPSESARSGLYRFPAISSGAGEIQIPFRPIAAKLSWMHKTGNYDVFVNGVKIASGKHILRTGVETFDLLRQPQTGEERHCLPRPVLRRALAELRHPAGRDHHRAERRKRCASPGDRQWRLELSGSGWMGKKPDFADQTWQGTRSPERWALVSAEQRTPISAGFAPDHMGPARDPRTGDALYPVFDYDKDIAWQIRRTRRTRPADAPPGNPGGRHQCSSGGL